MQTKDEQTLSHVKTIISSIVLTEVVQQSTEIHIKKSVEQLIAEEEGNIGYRAKFMGEQLPYLEAFLEDRVVPPYEIEVQSSSVCNAKCDHCFAHETLKGATKSKELLRDESMDHIMTKILEAEAYGLRVESIKFVGSCGDPLVNPKTLDAVRMSKGAGRITKLFTNGIGLSYLDPKQRMYSDHLFNIDYIRISLDAGSQQAFKDVKKVNGFYDVLNGIERLRKKADQHGSPLQIEIGYVITDKNYYDIANVCQLVKVCGAHSIRYRRDMIGESLPHEEVMQVQDSLDQAVALGDENFQVKIVHNAQEFEDNDPIGCEKCYVPFFWVTVGSDGRLYPCGHRGGDFGWDLGNLLQKDLMTLLEAQYSSPRAHSLPDNNCRVCPPYARRLNPFIHHIAVKDQDTQCIIGALRGVLTDLR